MIIADISAEFRRYIRDNYDDQEAAANHFGVRQSFISQVSTGVKPPTKAMLDEMGISKHVRKLVVYRKGEKL